MKNIIAIVPLLLGTTLTGCAMPTTALIDGKEVPRQTLKYTGDPYSVTHLAAHPRPHNGLEDHGGRITGPICGNDVDFEVKHEGDHIAMNGFVDAHFSSVLEVKDQNGERIISGNFGTGAGSSVIDLRLRSDGLVGRVGYREFNLKQEGDSLVGMLTQGTNLKARAEIKGRTEMWSMPAATQAVILANLLTCKGEWIARDGRRQLVVNFGGPAGFSPRNTSSLYETHGGGLAGPTER